MSEQVWLALFSTVGSVVATVCAAVVVYLKARAAEKSGAANAVTLEQHGEVIASTHQIVNSQREAMTAEIQNLKDEIAALKTAVKYGGGKS